MPNKDRNKNRRPEPWWEEWVFWAFVSWTVVGLILQVWGASKVFFPPNFTPSYTLFFLLRADWVTLLVTMVAVFVVVAPALNWSSRLLFSVEEWNLGGPTLMLATLFNLLGYLQLSIYLQESGWGAWVYGLFVLAFIWLVVCVGGINSLQRQRESRLS